MRMSKQHALVVLVGLVAGGLGCTSAGAFLNPSFLNYATGGVIPLTPGPQSGFVLVRARNNTQDAIEFIVTVEREVEVIPDPGVDAPVTTAIEQQTYRLITIPDNLANDVGILFDCPVSRVGLGENIDRPAEEPGLFIGTDAGGFIQGFGVPGNVNPLDAGEGNFACGDTVIFQASTSVGAVGNVSVTTFVLPAENQPAEVIGPDTFNNARSLVDQFAPEEDQ
jgi:hypothetical protein